MSSISTDPAATDYPNLGPFAHPTAARAPPYYHPSTPPNLSLAHVGHRVGRCHDIQHAARQLLDLIIGQSYKLYRVLVVSS